MAPDKTRTIRLQAFVRASPKKVFRAVSEPKRLRRWFVDEASLTPRKGGGYAYTWKDGPTHRGKVLEFVRGKRVTLTWQWPGIESELVTKLRFSVEPREDGTILKLTHSGFPKQEKWVDLYAGAVQGWTYFLVNFKSVLDHDHDLRSPHDWWAGVPPQEGNCRISSSSARIRGCT
ncbi:MAG: SRPBCC family protein [Thermoplasmata archaeon]